ncbi:MAG: hypothetical protein U0324_21955 [Polyangiales bacterium]
MRFPALCAFAFLAACSAAPRPPAALFSGPAAPSRLRFNQLALRLDLPLFWARDANGNHAPDPDEVRSLRFYPERGEWVRDGRFTPAWDAALARIAAEARAPESTDPRVRRVHDELDHTALTLVETDLADLPPVHRDFAARMLRVAERIDHLYAQQSGMTALADRARALDPASRSLFRRNWGTACRGANTQRDAQCAALPGAPAQPVDVYPAALQSHARFCAALEARADAPALLSPFTVVRGDGDALRAVPYTEAYGDVMRAVAAELRDAADAMSDPAEAALVAYLRAAATSFETNDWTPADEAWSRMNARNSRWYLRVAPDETYWEPCSQKAGFHLTLARINTASLTWQDRLTPLQNDMERALADLAPGAYTARSVSFHMPDFIDIVANAGDDRDAYGATVGQSLPNWGPVSAEGRGRTVAMSNLYTDPDSLARRRAGAASLLTAGSLADVTDDDGPGLLATILHEATHNLGPAHEYRASGRTADECFGGDLASMLEELKAQTGALYFTGWLRRRGVIDDATARRIYTDSVLWALDHIASGMYAPGGQRMAYSQLAAVQVGALLDDGALAWDDAAPAADGAHRGAFTFAMERFEGACERLMAQVMRIKATGDRAAAEALAARYVDGPRVPQAAVGERVRAHPQASFVYAVRGAGE